MKKFQFGFMQTFILVLLLVGIGAGAVLVQQKNLFRSKAYVSFTEANFKKAFNSCLGETLYDAQFDPNHDNCITLDDYRILLPQFKGGQPAIPTPTPTPLKSVLTPTPTIKPISTPTPTPKPISTPTPTSKPIFTPTPTPKPLIPTPTPTIPAGIVDNGLPSVNITSPAGNAYFSRNVQITLSASATDDVGITKVEFYDVTDSNNPILVCTKTSAPYSCVWTTPNRCCSSSLKAKAYDFNPNHVSESPVVPIIHF